MSPLVVTVRRARDFAIRASEGSGGTPVAPRLPHPWANRNRIHPRDLQRTAISPRQLSYELGAGLLAVLPIPLADTRRVIGITRRTDSLASPGAKILMEEIARPIARAAGVDRTVTTRLRAYVF
jgi:hypothetical protein